MKTYTYKANSYDNLYDLAEALAHDGTFIPRTISDTDLEQLGVVVAEAEEPIENIRARKIVELKRQRDAAEVEPIAYGGHLYDYDSKARDRISAAIIALDVQGEGAKISWTTADNEDAVVTADDLRAIVAAVAVRSNALHVAYRTAKAQVEAAGTADEVRAVTMN
ncbi:DUF4376 domain-containing protein [Phascolarctobacterium succinatutens]|jgi:dsDNA-binding SOS-regulon protein|uniref:DUF4376 domain-containing protein n=1 Tax=Phascolarctobacterium succinatutens TaxID=626940 RepID=UPI00204A2D51|nr:DUF4376 domain-containing protein [Phascolarctobacterium succinatutens]DAU03085.1 MAG TPA: protein of unknown function (DUF4376) [Caudoviricetes sp.]DAW13937.1 MAG TPA: protein of unknown function (DUF4376) [Caudoviricetes sp.]